MNEADLLSDEQLVGLTLEGDRDAFGQIVARYQSPICALAYSACGSNSRSEDLAQEVFIAAWRRLGQLKDPAKLKAWLFAITRNLINTSFRQQSRNPLSLADSLEKVQVNYTESSGPSETTISQEEEKILWQVLSGLPAVYRQPMVLFYRQDESTARVAEILEISEEAVRQRLSRGRAMLNERVAKLVEIGLRRSGPSKAFALAVLAALPAASIQAGSVGAVTAAAKGSSAFTGFWMLSAIGSAASAIGGVAGGLVGLWGRIQNTCSPRERTFVRHTVGGMLALALGFLLINRWLTAQGVLEMSLSPFDSLVCSLFWLAFLGPLFFYSIWRERQRRQIQIKEGTAERNPTWWMWRLGPAGPGARTATYGLLTCLIFGSCSWLMVAAAQVKDHLSVILLFALCAAVWRWTGRAILRCPERTPTVINHLLWGVALVNLITINLRWDAWFGGAPLSHFPSRLAPWMVDYWIIFLYATTRTGLRMRRHFLALPDARHAARLVISIYLGFLLFGSILLAAFK